MSCQNDCQLEIKFVCQQCDQLYCLTHGENHFNESGHAGLLTDEGIDSRIYHNEMKKSLKIEKCKHIKFLSILT